MTFLSQRACWYLHVFTAKKSTSSITDGMFALRFWKKNMAKKNFQILLQYLCNEPLSALKAIVGKIYGKSSLFCNIFSTKNMVKKKLLNLIAIVWTWPTECFWSDCGQNLWIAIFILQHVFDKHRIKTLIHFTAIVWTRPTECFKSDCEHNSYIQNYSNIV